MIDWLLGLWSKNKLLFILLIIPITLAFAIKIYQEILYQNAKGSLKDADKKSNVIKAKVDKQENEAAEELKKADEAADRIKAREESDKVNLDWHKKK